MYSRPVRRSAGPVVFLNHRILPQIDSMRSSSFIRSMSRRGALISSAALIGGCYTQRPLTTPVPFPGTRIVAELTDTGTVAMGNQLGPGVTEVEGIVSSADASRWRLLMVRADQRGGASTLWNREPVTFPRLALTQVTERQLDKKRSWLMAGAIVAAAFIAARAFGAFNISDEGGGQTGTPQ
jgi:hypothetical protein